jgi:hypothetical protein
MNTIEKYLKVLTNRKLRDTKSNVDWCKLEDICIQKCMAVSTPYAIERVIDYSKNNNTVLMGFIEYKEPHQVRIFYRFNDELINI